MIEYVLLTDYVWLPPPEHAQDSKDRYKGYIKQFFFFVNKQ